MDIKKQFEMYANENPDYSKIHPEQDYAKTFEQERKEREYKEEPLTDSNKTLEETVQNITPEDFEGPITFKEKIEHCIPSGLITEVTQNLPYMIIGTFAIYNVLYRKK